MICRLDTAAYVNLIRFYMILIEWQNKTKKIASSTLRSN